MAMAGIRFKYKINATTRLDANVAPLTSGDVNDSELLTNHSHKPERGTNRKKRNCRSLCLKSENADRQNISLKRGFEITETPNAGRCISDTNAPQYRERPPVTLKTGFNQRQLIGAIVQLQNAAEIDAK
ncbi:hypothetical protein F2P81_020510 [Scophthalmus maximus]|uniref:Uncharacterized protein n=1 Tax=Scophthalmus maximus TaxID=52904 RepID=A0A6A4S5D7_SCOMX|nr:hypothetical protein F2P81_020510 [Scophthalmus maximus]